MKKNVLSRVCKSVLITGGILLGTVMPVIAVGAATDVGDEDYDAVFKLSNEHIVSVTNNGRQYGSSALKYLTDGNLSTHWETGKPNSDSFKNEVVVTFDEEVSLGRLVYYPRTDGAAKKGFPTEYSIYASDSLKDDDFELVKKGTAEAALGATQMKFDETSFTRLKFVFEKANQNWAAGGEMMFYKSDLLPDEVDNLFTDGTMTALNPEYQDISVLKEFMAQAKAHPDKSLEERVQTAIDILNGTVDYTGDVITVEQKGDMYTHSTKVLRTAGYGNNFLPTGYTALAGDTVKIYVDAEEGAPLPSVAFTQQIGKFSNWMKTYKLQQGENILTAPRMFNESWSTKTIPGGAIYIMNPYTAENQGAAPKVRITGAEKYPLFRDGDDEGAFLEQLRAYQQKLKNEPDTTVDIVEIYSDSFILNANMKAAEPFLKGTANPQKTVDLHNARQAQLLGFAGIDDRSFEHSRNNVRANIRLMQPYGMGYAASGHVGIQQSSANIFFKGDLTGWLYSHELGHQLDTRSGYIGEVTNNMWANYIAVDIQKEYDRASYDKIFQQQASDDYVSLVNGNDDWTMYWQLHLLNENYWPEYQSAYREDVAANMGLSRNERMAVVSCYAVGMDVIEHFERYKFVERNDKIDAALAALDIQKAPENVKPWYLWTKATKDRVSAFERSYTPEITSIMRSGDSLKISMSIDSEADNALLGYEVMEDGKVLGFTSANTFTGSFTDDGQEHTYTVRAYDLRMNASQISEPSVKNLKSPVIQVSGSNIAALYDEFDPLANVSAVSWDGQDISSNIEVTVNSVDTAARGIYEVTYSVQDAEGYSAEKTVEVEVVSTFEYLSDMQEVSAKTGYKSLTKDKAISGGKITLLRNQTPVTYEKGLGAHASSSIVYNIEGKDYSYFESYIGIDQSMKNSTAANAKFRVLVDGEIRYESGVMKASTDSAYVKVDVRGAKTIELVADSNGSNSQDHTVWADARLTVTNSVPVIHAQNATYLDPDSVNLDEILAAVTAEDVEDGDLTDAITYDTNLAAGQTGNFDITYTVTDSDGNTVSLTKKIVVVNDFVYVSDVDWKSAKVGWGSIKKDKSLDGKEIKLLTDAGVTTYEKGLGVHAHSEVVYDLTDKDYYYFTSDVGVDNTAANGNSSVKFQVYVDGVLAAETPVMRKDDAAQQFCVDISSAKQLKLVVTNGGNGNANDHADWADAKFLTATTVEYLDTAELEQVIEFAEKITDMDYVDPSLKHGDIRLSNLKLALADVIKVLETGEDQPSIDMALAKLKCFIEDVGQVYTPNGEPVSYAAEDVKEETPEAEVLTEGDIEIIEE